MEFYLSQSAYLKTNANYQHAKETACALQKRLVLHVGNINLALYSIEQFGKSRDDDSEKPDSQETLFTSSLSFCLVLSSL